VRSSGPSASIVRCRQSCARARSLFLPHEALWITLAHQQFGLGALVSWFVQNLVQGLLAALWAAIWPVVWISRLGVGVKSGVLLAASYGAYRVIHPWVSRWLRGEEE